MVFHRNILTALLLAPMTLVADDSDTANERIPVTNSEMEIHWQVDCLETWRSLARAAQTFTVSENCDIPDELLRKIQLCAFIYQPPASARRDNCPNYRAAQAAAQRGDCRAMSALPSPLACKN